MAYATGTATDRHDLWNKLLSFLTTNPTLVAANQAWEVVWSYDSTEAGVPTTRRLLKGKGLSGLDEIYVSLMKQDNLYNPSESLLWIGGATGVSPSATSILGHTNALPRFPAMFLDTGPMSYWFAANGRRFVVVVRMSTVYNMIYGGLILPYATPQTFKYPLFIGGCRGYQQAGNTAAPTVDSWRNSETNRYSGFMRPQARNQSSDWYDSSAAMLDPTGIWNQVSCDQPANTGATCWMSPGKQQTTLQGVLLNNPTYQGQTIAYTNGLGYRDVSSKIIEGLDGEIPITPLTVYNSFAGDPESPTTYGILDGCYEAGGIGLTAESTFTVDGVPHIIFQNVMRTNVASYWALAQE